MKQLSFLLALCLCVFAASCDSSDKDGDKDSDKFEVTMTFNQTNAVTGPDRQTTAYPTSKYTYKIDYNKAKVDITVEKVRFSSMMPAITMELKNVPIKFPLSYLSSSYFTKIEGKDIIPEIPNTETGESEPMEGYTISSISGYIIPSPVIKTNSATLTFVINGVFIVNAYPDTSIYEFERTTSVTGPGNPFSYDYAYYAINLNSEQNAAHLYLYNTKFAEKMPAMNMIFKNIPVTFNSTGYQLNCESLIPCLNNSGATPMEDYPITNLSGSVTNGKLNLQFDCSINASGSSVEGITYHVTTSASNLPKFP